MVSSPVYFDTNIWYSYFVKDRHSGKAKKLFELVEKNKSIVLVSELIILELIDIIKKRIIENSEYSDLSDDRIKELVKEYEQKRLDVVEKISFLLAKGKIIIKDPDCSIKQTYNNIKKYSSKGFGEINSRDYCFDCEQKLPKPKYKYRGVGSWDILHALTVKDLGIKDFYTFDKGFSELAINKDFNSVNFKIL